MHGPASGPDDSDVPLKEVELRHRERLHCTGDRWRTRYALGKSEHLYLIIEGSGPSWATLHAPEPELEKNVLGADDIGEAGGGAFVGWAVHIDAENRSLVYRLTAYLQSTASYEAHRQR